jgi:hypothetical protein
MGSATFIAVCDTSPAAAEAPTRLLISQQHYPQMVDDGRASQQQPHENDENGR